MLSFTLTSNEAETVSVMWEIGKPLTRGEILALSPDRLWHHSSIHIILNRLIEKGAIVVDGYTKTGKSYGRTYSPTVTADEYFLMLVQNAMKHVNNKSSAIIIVIKTLLENENLNNDIINEWLRRIEKRKQELKKEADKQKRHPQP